MMKLSPYELGAYEIKSFVKYDRLGSTPILAFTNVKQSTDQVTLLFFGTMLLLEINVDFFTYDLRPLRYNPNFQRELLLNFELNRFMHKDAL